MDLLFKRYASPFLLIDNLISAKRFLAFVKEFINITNDEEIYELWLHRIFDKTYEEFRNEILTNNQNIEAEDQDVETTIKDSYDTLNNFKPE